MLLLIGIVLIWGLPQVKFPFICPSSRHFQKENYTCDFMSFSREAQKERANHAVHIGGYLATSIITFGSPEIIKDIMTRRDIELPDLVVSNMLKPELQLMMEAMAFDHLFPQQPVL